VVIDWNVVPTGVCCVNVTFAEVAGPLFVTVSLNVTRPPGTTGSGDAATVTARSALPVATTVVVVDDVLFEVFESGVVLDTVAVSVITVPDAVPGLTRTCSGKLRDAPLATGVADEQLIAPVPPTAGVMQVHPAGGVSDWNVQFAGTFSVNVGFAAESRPLFLNVCVYVMLLLGCTGSGESVIVTMRSAYAFVTTFVVVVALLFAGFESCVEEVALAVLLMT
jgi:hypothetical protein